MIDLSSVRGLVGITQVHLAKKLGIPQSRISSLENQSDWRLSTLADYFTALGVEAELVLRLPDGQTIRQPLD